MYKSNSIAKTPSFFFSFFSVLTDFVMWTGGPSPAAQLSAGCHGGRPPALTSSLFHICLSITAWPPCYSFSNSEFLRQPAVLYRPQKYLSHCTTEICKTICQGEVCLKCLSETACRLEDNPSKAAIPDHTLRIKKIIAKEREKGLENSNSFYMCLFFRMSLPYINSFSFPLFEFSLSYFSPFIYIFLIYFFSAWILQGLFTHNTRTCAQLLCCISVLTEQLRRHLRTYHITVSTWI